MNNKESRLKKKTIVRYRAVGSIIFTGVIQAWEENSSYNCSGYTIRRTASEGMFAPGLDYCIKTYQIIEIVQQGSPGD